MSYRISLSGYRREQMRSLIGSKNVNAIERLHSKLNDKDPNSAAYRDIITRAINQGTPFPELEAETHIHTRVASLMAQDQQELLFTNCDYHWDALRASRKRIRNEARPDVRAYFTGLLEGVPIFGRRFADAGSPYYASLALAKVCGFHDGLQEYRDSLPEPDPDDDDAVAFLEFVATLTESLREIKDAGLDLWFQTG